MGLPPDAMRVNGPQLDARLGESGRHLPQQGAEAGFERVLGLWIGLYMTWARFQPAGAESPQGALSAPADLTTDRASEVPAKPGGYGPSAPAVAVGMRAGQGCSELRQLGGG